MNDDKATIRVYYNGACPVCRAGIEAQKKKMDAGVAEFADVHLDNAACRDVGADLEFVRKRLHVIDETGRVRVGAEAFEAIWRITPGEEWKARVIGAPVIRQLAIGAYNAFAWCLYRFNRMVGRWQPE